MPTILITGSTGFIGSRFMRYIIDNTDWNVIGLDRRVPDNPHVFTEDEDRAIVNVKMDLKNIFDIKGNIDYVVHFAAEKDVKRSFVDIEPYIISNVLGSARLFSWLRGKNCKKIINFSTASVLGPYGAKDGIADKRAKPFFESDPIMPHNPYAGSKAAQEAIALAYRNTYHMPIDIVRIDTPFGEGQPADNFIPFIINKLKANQPIYLYGKILSSFKESLLTSEFNYAKRNWIYLDDLCKHLVDILEGKHKRYLTGHIWHLTGNNYSVKDIAQKIAAHMNVELKYENKEIDSTDFSQDTQLQYGIRNLENYIRNDWEDNSLSGSEFNERLNKVIDWTTLNRQ